MDHFDRQREEIERIIDERNYEREMRERREEERRRMIMDDPFSAPGRPSDAYRKFVTEKPHEWWKEEYSPWERGAREAMERSQALRRNSRGQVMYSEKCISCVNHKEETMVCDLCNTGQTVERIHENINQWVEEFPHYCKQAKQRLSLILYAIIV